MERDLIERSYFVSNMQSILYMDADVVMKMMQKMEVRKEEIVPHMNRIKLNVFKRLHDHFQFQVEDVRSKVMKVATDGDVEFLTWFLKESGLTFQPQDVFTPLKLSFKIRSLLARHIGPSYFDMEMTMDKCWNEEPRTILENAIKMDEPTVAEWCIHYYCLYHFLDTDMKSKLKEKGWNHLIIKSASEIAEELKSGDLKLKGGVTFKQILSFQDKINQVLQSDTKLTYLEEKMLQREFEALRQ